MTSDLLLYGEMLGAAFVLVASIAIVAMGEYIDVHPKGISKGGPRWSLPATASTITAVVILALYAFGSVLSIIAETIPPLAVGIAFMSAAILTAFTTMAFSAAVLARLNAL